MTTKKTATRIYLVTDKQSQQAPIAVRATNPSQAVNYATRDRFSIRVATVDDFIPRNTVLDATVPGVHPDQQKMPLNASIAQSASGVSLTITGSGGEVALP